MESDDKDGKSGRRRSQQGKAGAGAGTGSDWEGASCVSDSAHLYRRSRSAVSSAFSDANYVAT